MRWGWGFGLSPLRIIALSLHHSHTPTSQHRVTSGSGVERARSGVEGGNRFRHRDTAAMCHCCTARCLEDAAGWGWDSNYRLYFTGISADVVMGTCTWYGEHTGRRGGSGHSKDRAIAMAMTTLRSGEVADGRGVVGEQRLLRVTTSGWRAGQVSVP